MEQVRVATAISAASVSRCAANATVLDQDGKPVVATIPGERALTIYLDKREIVTLMTLGQRLVERLRDIAQVRVDLDVGAAVVSTHDGDAGARCEQLLRRRWHDAWGVDMTALHPG